MCLNTSVWFQIKDKLDNIETKLMNRRPKDLLDEIEALRKKTEQNREMARDAREAADSALNKATDTEPVRRQTQRQEDHRHRHRKTTDTERGRRQRQRQEDD